MGKRKFILLNVAAFLIGTTILFFGIESQLNKQNQVNFKSKGIEKEIKTFEIEVDNSSFSLKEIRANKDNVVRIVFRNNDDPRDFIIEDFGISTKKIAKGQSEVMEFIVNKNGVFQYYSTCNKNRTLFGTLIIN